jgi:maleylacetate reductase
VGRRVVTIRTFNHRFAHIDEVIDGAGSVSSVLPALIERVGARRVVVVTNRSLAEQTSLVAELEEAVGDRRAATYGRMPAHAPRVAVDEAAALATSVGADALIGYGGSSVTDATKIVAKLRRDATGAAPPFVLVPTTLSAGEYTAAAGMTGDVPGVKTYVVDPCMAARAVVLDPEVTLPTPLPLWLSTGMKTVDHACEALWGPRRHPLTDTLAIGALQRVVPALERTAADPADLDARLDAQLAGFLSMHCVQHSVVYLAHVLGHQIAARWDVEHGVTSCITLPVVLDHLRSGSPDGVALVEDALDAPRDGGADALRGLVGRLGLPGRLRDVGAARGDFGAVADATVVAARQLGFDAPDPRTLVHLLDQMW